MCGRLVLIDNHYEDIPGMLSERDIYTALYRFKELFGLTIDAFIFYNHETIDRSKWRIKKLRLMCKNDKKIQEFYNKALKLLFPQFDSENDIKNIINEGMMFMDDFVRETREAIINNAAKISL